MSWQLTGRSSVVGAPSPILGPLPFVYDIENDRIHVGNPGGRHAEIKGQFTPGGVVEGLYLPDGKMQFRTDTDMPYTIRHMIQLWYAMHPELEVKSVYKLEDGKPYKLASSNIVWKVANLVDTDEAAREVFLALRQRGANVYVVGGAIADVVRGSVPSHFELMVEGLTESSVAGVLETLPGSLIKEAESLTYLAEDGSNTTLTIPQTGGTDPSEGDLLSLLNQRHAAAVCLNTAELLDPAERIPEFKKVEEQVSTVKQRPAVRAVRESNILDPVKSSLDPAVWDGAGTARPRIKPHIAKWIRDEITRVMTADGWPDPSKYLSLVLTGSLTTYQWAPHSDCDVSVWIDVERFPEFVRADLIATMIAHMDGTLVPGTQHPLQCFIVNSEKIKREDIYKPGLRSAYDLDADRWIVPPDRDAAHDVAKEYPRALGYARLFTDKLKLMMKYDPEMVKPLWDSLHRQRMHDQSAGLGDFAPSNIVFKMISNAGLFPEISRLTGEYIAKAAPLKVSFIREADWADVADKAKRLVMDGNVTIMTNRPNYVGAIVRGDHGTYQTEISRHDPDSQVIEQWGCFLADAPITMADGTRKPISEIQAGDLVRTHEGNVRPVTKIWSRPYEGDLARIRLTGMHEEIVATSNHPFWAANEDFHHARRNGWEGKFKSAHHANRRGSGNVDYELEQRTGRGSVAVPLEPKVDWIEAGDLSTRMYLSMAAPNAERECVVDGRSISGDLAYLIGWYVAEGFIIKSTKNRVGFSLGPKEWDVAVHLSEICERHFGTPGTIRASETGIDFRVSSPSFRRIVEELVGTGAATKRLSRSILEMPIEDQRLMMDAWWQGDGYQDGNRRGLSTVSETLAHQARQILARLGMDSLLRWRDNNLGNGFVSNARRIYEVRWQPKRKRLDSERFYKDGQVWMRIESVELEPFEGEVWDMEVGGDHSFQAFSVNVHNCTCPWSQYAFDRTRKWKKLEGRPCSHVMAVYWKAKSTPLDVSDMDQGYQVPRGQMRSPAGPGQMELPAPLLPTAPPAEQVDMVPPVQDQQQGQIEQPAGVPTDQNLAIPQQPMWAPQQPGQRQGPQRQPQQQPMRQQLTLWDVTVPQGVTGQPIPPGQIPTVLFPGALSRVYVVASNDWIHYSKSAIEEWAQELLSRGRIPAVQIVHPNVHLEQRGGKIPAPGSEPVGWTQDGLPQYRTSDLGWDPVLQRRVRADEGTAGAPEQRGVFSPVKPGMRAELRAVEPLLGMAYVVVPMRDSGPLHPHALEGWLDYGDIVPTTNQQTPFRAGVAA